MHLAPREIEKLLLHSAGCVAQKRLARGLRLNHPEAVALIATQLLEFIREGKRVAELMDLGRKFLGRNQVMPGIPEMITEVQVEGTFPDGTKLVTVHHPVASEHGDLKLALYGSFLPVPDLSLFKPAADSGVPGDCETLEDDIELNSGRATVELPVTNLGDRPIQVGSHYHFIETNASLEFDRGEAYGKRLDIPAGTAVRFEPGETKTVRLVEIAGGKVIRGGNNLGDGPVCSAGKDAAMVLVKSRGFAHKEHAGKDLARHKARDAQQELTHHKERDAQQELTRHRELKSMAHTMKRRHYSEMFGPTTGDRVRLGDTSLYLQIEKDYAVYGDECKFGGGKVIREGMGQAAGVGDRDAVDCLITNALIVDWTGIYKADIGIKGGRIAGIGKAGNPDVMAGVSPGMIIGVTTEIIAGEGLIVTAGGIDSHIHFICPQQAQEAIAAGLTTMIGGGTGPAVGTCATTCTPGSFHIRMMLQAVDALPLNFGFTGKGNTALPAGLADQIEAGAIGLKLHEDWGTTPAAIDCCLGVAEDHDVQVTIHTDTLNESAFVEGTLAALKGRTIHTYHSEGAGGGHAPDIIRICGAANVLPSSTNPTRPYTVNTIDEHLDMLMVCHHLDANLPEDVAFAESRIRGETIAAEDILHDLGAISMMSSDSQAMGRIGEVITRTWQTADKMRQQRGRFSEETGPNDNVRIKRYLSEYTINPAIAHGISHLVGSIEPGKLADLVLWRPAFFGAKPEMVIKGGIIAWSQMGDPNASIPTPQPVLMRPMFGSLGRAVAAGSLAFVSQACQAKGLATGYGLGKRLEAVRGCRKLGKKDMKWNGATPVISVDSETYEVRADGELLTCQPAQVLPLAQKYFLF